MTDRPDEEHLAVLLKRIVEQCPHPSRLIELYYWSAEDQLAEVMRQYIALTPEVRTALHGFLMLVKDEPGSVTVQISANGAMTFSAPTVVDLAEKIGSQAPPPPFLH
jgi:hypothetical protein